MRTMANITMPNLRTMVAIFSCCFLLTTCTEAFVIRPVFAPTSASSSSSSSAPRTFASTPSRPITFPQLWAKEKKEEQAEQDSGSLKRVSSDLEGVPIPFLDVAGNAFIECYADSVATLNGVSYTIGVPCDYSVALCTSDVNEQLVPVELDDPVMDDLFAVAEGIVAEEFGEELALQRTPQTLTLVGELEDDEEEFTEDDDVDLDDDDDDDEEEEVEVLLAFEHRGKEYTLVRLLDPILLVGKADTNTPDNRVLLTEEESDKVMPILEKLFLEQHEDDAEGVFA